MSEEQTPLTLPAVPRESRVHGRPWSQSLEEDLRELPEGVAGRAPRGMPLLLHGLAGNREAGPSIAARILREQGGLPAKVDQQDLDALEAIAAQPQ